VFDGAGFELLQGEPRIYKAKAQSGGSSFCGDCGVHVFSRPDGNPHLVAIKIGSLDAPSGFRVDADMWMGSAQPWHQRHEGGGAVCGECGLSFVLAIVSDFFSLTIDLIECYPTSWPQPE
jgi:hypothetical protein